MTEDTDQVEQPRRTPPPPRRKTSPKRTPPPRRGERSEPSLRSGNGNGGGAHGANAPEPSLSDVLAAVNTVVSGQAKLEQEVEQLKTGATRFVESQTEPKVIGREADDEELTDFQRELREDTQPTPQDYVRKGKDYNYPALLYAKPDGSIVSLQGDPGNRSYYKDKGFVELDAEQTRRWYGGEKQKLVVIQREKAELINTLRELVARDENLRRSISGDTEKAWDHMSVAELETFMDDVMGMPDANGKPRRKLRPPKRLIDAENRKAQAEIDRMLAGVETERLSMEEFQAKLERGRKSGQAFR